MKREYLKVEGMFEILRENNYLDDEFDSEHWQEGFSTNEFKSKKADDFIRNIGELHKIGSDAESEYLLVNLNKKINENEYETVKRNVAIAVETISYNGTHGTFYNGQGDPVRGIFNIQTGIFT